jgi:small-conductance mechanosensitive channel
MEPRMKHQIFLTLGCAAVLVAAAGAPALAQDAQNGQSLQAATKASSATSKKHKVWTDDDVSTLRTPEDNYVEQKQAAEAATVAANATAAQAKSKPKTDKPVGGPPALSNPKSPEDADRMIAWESRDVDAQQEYIDKLRTQLEQASPEDRDHLENNLAKHIQMLEQTKKERDALVTQKKELQKKAGSEAKPVDSASTSTPQ